MSSQTILIGPYSRARKFRDFLTLSMFAIQGLVWWVYDIWWALMLPVFTFGTLAAYFTAQDDAMFDMWLKFRKSFIFLTACLCVFAVISYAFAKFWNPCDVNSMIAAVILCDAAYVYGATILCFFVRQRRDDNNSAG